MFSVISSFKNESANCKDFFEIISKCKKYINISEVVVVDNGSTDNTLELLKNQKIYDTNILVLNNDSNSGYGDGFSKALNSASNNYIITIHSDNQFRLDKFLEQYSTKIKEDLKNNISIFPIRTNRSLVANLRTLIVRLILSIISFRFFNDYGGHPKFLLKEKIKNINSLPSGFSFDAAILFFLKKNKIKLNQNYYVSEHDRIFGESSWSKSLFKQFILLLKFVYEFFIFRVNN